MAESTSYNPDTWKTSFKPDVVMSDDAGVDKVIQLMSSGATLNSGMNLALQILLGTKIGTESLGLQGKTIKESMMFIEIINLVTGGDQGFQVVTPDLTSSTTCYSNWSAEHAIGQDKAVTRILYLWVLLSAGYKGARANLGIEGARSMTVTVAAKSGVGVLPVVPEEVRKVLANKPNPQNMCTQFHIQLGRWIKHCEEMDAVSSHPLVQVARSLRHPLWSWTGPNKALPVLNAHLELSGSRGINFDTEIALYAYSDAVPALLELEEIVANLDSCVINKQSTVTVLLNIFINDRCYPNCRGSSGNRAKAMLILVREYMALEAGDEANPTQVLQDMKTMTGKGLPKEVLEQIIIPFAKSKTSVRIDTSLLTDLTPVTLDDDRESTPPPQLD